MVRSKRNQVPFKKAKRAAEQQQQAARKVREMKQKFQAVHDEKKSLTPGEIHTHARQRTYPIATFTELLTRAVPWASSTSDEENVYFFCDYCIQALKIMQIVIETLSTKALAQQRQHIAEQRKLGGGDATFGAPMAILSLAERDSLQALRSAWLDHLKNNLYSLWTPPPSSGGATARYSIAVQVWLLVTHANVILQRSNATDALFDFNPSTSIYLLRNSLVIDTGPVMCYSMRTLLMAIDKFILELDSLDRFHPDYITYAVALEHRLSEVIAEVGSGDEFDALEWCVSHGARAVEEAKKAEADNFIDQRRKKKDRIGGASTQRHALQEHEEQCSDEFIMATMVWMLTIYRYAECWFKLSVRVLSDNRVQHTRVPAHVVARSDWLPSSRSIRAFSQLMLHYTKTLQDDVYTRMQRLFLLQFELRASDMDMVRLFDKHNYVHARSVLEYEFKGRSAVARAYVRKVHYDRKVYEYVAEALQWESGDETTTSSGSLMRQGFVRQLAIFFAIHQLIESRFRFPWKQRFLLFHRDVGFVERFERARTFGVPFIVQQFRRFSVFVPHRRDPALDIAAILRWRANSRRALSAQAQHTNFAGNAVEQATAMNDLTDAMKNLQMMGDEYNNANRLRAGDEPDVDPTYGAAAGGGVGMAPESEAGLLRDYQTQQFNRVYDCLDALTAFAVWSIWLLQLNDGVIDSEINMRQFILEAFEWVKP